MKKLFSLLLAAVMFAVLMPVLPAEAAAKSYYSVNAEDVCLREGHKYSSDTLEKLDEGDVVVRTNSKTYSGNGQKWYRVKSLVSGKSGYMVAKYLDKIKSANLSRVFKVKLLRCGISPAFDMNKKAYKIYYDDSLKTPKIKLWQMDKKAAVSMTVDGAAVDMSAYASGETYIKLPKKKGAVVKITLAKGAQKTVYTFTMKKLSDKSTTLKALSLSNAAISPAFDPAVNEYTATVAYKEYETKVCAEKYSAGAKLSYKLDGIAVSSSTIPLDVGKSKIEITVKNAAGVSRVYTLTVTRKSGKASKNKMTGLERKFVETAFRLLPYRHPFVIAYEKTYGIDIKSYKAKVNGVNVSGIPFEFGGGGHIDGYSSSWWKKTGVSQYPVRGLDCAEYMVWIYKQLGYDVADSSSGLFLSGVAGVTRKIPGVRAHKVIPSFEEAKIGDICYTSKDYTFRSGHGCHVVMFLGTARQLGIVEELRKMYPGFPQDSYLAIDVGWADGNYYYTLMKKLNVKSGRRGMCGVGVQFFPTVKSGSKILYKSPSKKYAWKDSKTGYTFTVERPLERNRRPLQYKASSKIKYIMNISRPIVRYD